MSLRSRLYSWLGALLLSACAFGEATEEEAGDEEQPSSPVELPVCMKARLAPEPVPLHVLFLLNRSLSMAGAPDRPYFHWTTETLLSFVDQWVEPHVSLGLQVFPAYEQEACFIASYSQPQVPWLSPSQATPLWKQLIQNALESTLQGRGVHTPLLPALQGSYAQLSERLMEYPQSQAAVVLLTRGATTSCGAGHDEGEVREAVRRAAQGEPPIRTFVAVWEDAAGLEVAEFLAQEGGTGEVLRLSANEGAEQVQRALEQIRSRSVTCQFHLEEPAGGELVPSSVRLQGVTKQGELEAELVWVEEESACESEPAGFWMRPTASGWEVQLCPLTCAILQTAPRPLSWSVEVGCIAQVR